MRLKKLTMQAFGPFKDKIIIDFEQNKIDKGLLLISGDTGAGKTTIFDAICYALYGQTSGEVRTANSLRSDWASLDIDTFVDLEFYYKNKLYEVKRSPEYNRKKKNGIGDTKQPSTAELNINGRIITKVIDVTKEIENLIGLDYKQFRQVAMLSQGEFTKFLLATSDEKTTIFRKIFGTEFYDKLQIKLKLNKSLKEEELNKIKDKIDSLKSNLESIINIYGLNNEETIKTLETKIKEDNDKLLLTKFARDKKIDEKTNLVNELNNINELNKKINNYQLAKNELNNLILVNKDIQKERKRYEYNINIANTITNILNGIAKDKVALNDKKEKEKLSKINLDRYEKEYKDKEVKFINLDNYSKNVGILNAEINKLTDTFKSYNNYLNKMDELEKTEEEYKLNLNKYESRNALYESMRQKYYLNISVSIAETLIDGEACPVCGSKSHPMKAQAIDCEYTKEDLENAERELKRIDGLRKRNEARIDEIRKSIKELNIPNDINVLEEKNKISLSLQNLNEDKEKLEEEFKTLSREKEQLVSNIKSSKDNIKIFNDDIKALEGNIENANRSLESVYKENDTNYSEYLENKIDKTSLMELKNRIEQYDKRKQELEVIIKSLELEVKGKDIIDLSSKEKQLNIVLEEYKELDDLYTKLNTSLVKLKDSTKSIENYIEEFKNIEGEYSIIEILSDTANGVLVGKQRITFENYVQSYFMNSVLVEANKRLLKMTDSRYELKKKETEIKLNVKSGLDFSIFDSYTGKERDVASLSGGEKFKASLALALGLSDTISNNCGGIKIDSLFIDEGFGSLDSESLNQALNILSDLSNNDKLVGVISHVSELKSRIDNKIIVTKTNTGSIVSVMGK